MKCDQLSTNAFYGYMKALILPALIISMTCHGQSTEFKVYPNGLIYDSITMHRLSGIVDSLNIRFRSCDLAHPYVALRQGYALRVHIPNRHALRLIRENISLEAYGSKFPNQVETEKVWIYQTRYTTWEGKHVLAYQELPADYSEFSVEVPDHNKFDKTNGWVVDEGSEDHERALFLLSLEDKVLPLPYARLVQYVDCMIDTTAEIYFPEAKAEVYQSVDSSSKAGEFVAMADQFAGKPAFPDEELEKNGSDSIYAKYAGEWHVWDSLRMISLDKVMKNSVYWNQVLDEAIADAVSRGNSNDRLEYYVGRYRSEEDELRLKRSRRVMGNCSMDQSPRYHAMRIATLAARTAKWDIFLRSHLDVMNDRFDRLSDGSYAWASRRTYLKELEELNLNVIDLLLGIALRTASVGPHHYWGSVSRIGRALADAEDKSKVEQQLLAAVGDEKLDHLNRLLMGYVYSNYVWSLPEGERERKMEPLESRISSWPSPLKAVWYRKD